MASLKLVVALSIFLGCCILVVNVRPSFAMPIEGDIIDGDSEESGDDDDDMDDVDDDDDEKSDHSFTDEEDNDVTITDNDIKEALEASSGELDASGRETSDVDSSGSQSEVPISKSQNKGDANPKDESKSSKTENAAQKKASQPPNEKSDSTTRKEENESEPPQEGSKAQIEQSQPQEKAVSSQMPPPADRKTSQLSNNKQSSDTDEEDDDDTPPPDETLMKAAQANYAADQQAERAMYYLSHPRQNGAHPSAARRTIICQGTTQKISCPPDKKLRILNADYGDTGDAGCLREVNPEPSGPCRTPGAFEVVRRECEGYEDCELPASNEVFGDACPDANKYLDVNYDCVNNPVAPAVAAYRQAPPQYANPPPVSYAPAPYQAPPPAAYGGLPNLLPPVPYAAPDPCNPCNTCAQCALPVCSPCGSTCQILTCGPQIPAKLQPLWQQFNERTADMSRMEMAALIISPLPKLSPTKAPESSESSSGAAEGSESGEPTMDEEALYEASKKSKIQRIKPQKKSKKTSLTPAKKKADKKNDSDQGFVRNNDSTISSGDTSSGSST